MDAVYMKAFLYRTYLNCFMIWGTSLKRLEKVEKNLEIREDVLADFKFRNFTQNNFRRKTLQE